MTNKDKLKELFGLEEVQLNCSCTRDKLQEKCIVNGRCLGCKMWLEAEYKEPSSESDKEGE